MIPTEEEQGVKDTAALTEKYVLLLQKFQRDINRVSDTDRNTRKRGLQKLFDELPWEAKGQRKILEMLITENLLNPLIAGLADSVEKCRELSISLLKRSFAVCRKVKDDVFSSLVSVLCARVGEIPFPEPSEELRLQVLELLTAMLQNERYKITSNTASTVIEALSKALTDNFPSAKRAAAELLCFLAEKHSSSVRLHFRLLLKGLTANALHQHSKTRSTTLKALGLSLACVIEDYETVMPDPVLPLLSRMVGDRTTSTRKELAVMLGNLLQFRLKSLGTRALGNSRSTAYVEKDHHVSSSINRRKALPEGDSPAAIAAAKAAADLHCVSYLILLQGDEAEEVVDTAKKSLLQVAEQWCIARDHPVQIDGTDDVDNAELELRKTTVTDPYPKPTNGDDLMDISEDTSSNLSGNKIVSQGGVVEDVVTPTVGVMPVCTDPTPLPSFLTAYLKSLIDIISTGISEWTLDVRRRNLRGLDVLIANAGGDSIIPFLPDILSTLSAPIRDEDPQVRIPAEGCCTQLGIQVDPGTMLDLLIPKVSGDTPGGDTFSQRTSAIRLLTHILQGFPQQLTRAKGAHTDIENAEAQADLAEICSSSVSSALADPRLYEFREPALREAALLLVRSLIDAFPKQCCSCRRGSSSSSSGDGNSSGGSSSGGGSGRSSNISSVSTSRSVSARTVGSCQDSQGNVVSALVYLQSRCPGEGDIVPEVAKRELAKFARLCAGEATSGAAATEAKEAEIDMLSEQLLSTHFASILSTVCPPDVSNPEWSSQSHSKATFEVLIRSCPSQAWAQYERVIEIIQLQVQPKKGPAEGTTEYNMKNYASVRGEAEIPSECEVDVRLSLLALLEGLVRAGSANWKCGTSIAASAEVLLCKIVIPNLIWRVGRVEATIRKVALAVCFGLLKAGAVKPEAMYKAAPELVPLITSSLDDMDEPARLMACLCLTVIFERLRGAFGEQAVHELYPKLLKRLDDSSDQVRLAACATLEMFLQAAPSQSYSSTTVEYTLDQLFIHLDDPEPLMQQAVFGTIIAASKLNKDLVIKKAGQCKTSHRSPDMCDKVIVEVRGYEIIEE